MKAKNKFLTAMFLFTAGFSGSGLYLLSRPPAFIPNEAELKQMAPEQWTSESVEPFEPRPKVFPGPERIDGEDYWDAVEELERNHEPQIEPGFEDTGFPGWLI